MTSQAVPFALARIVYRSTDCVTVKPVRQGRFTDGGFRVTISIPPDLSDDMWETLDHFALFADRADAEAVAAAIRSRREVDLNAYVWHPSRCTPYAALQKAPTAKLEKAARPSTGRNALLS